MRRSVRKRRPGRDAAGDDAPVTTDHVSGAAGHVGLSFVNASFDRVDCEWRDARMSDGILQAYARLAGFMYLAVMAAFIAPFAMLQSLAVPGDFARTAANVAAAEPIYRAALSIQTFGCVGIVLLSGALYAVLCRVDARLALLALVWRAGEAILLAVGAIIRFAVLKNYIATVGGAGAVEREALHELMSSAVGASSYVAFIFLALGSIVFFYLFFRSRLIPRALSGFAMLASLLMLALAFAYLFAPDAVAGVGMTGMAPMFVAEVGVGLWLLIGGVSRRHARALSAQET
jgi:hypothetical protein